MAYLNYAERHPDVRFDLVIVDPPTFGAADARRNIKAWQATRDYPRLLQAATRVLMPGGQVLLSIPLRNSFVEIADLLREYATKHDQKAVADAVEAAVALRPTPESLADELEALGFVDVDVDFRSATIPFQGGRDFLEDPTTRLLLMPEWQLNLGLDEATFRAAFQYVRDAIDRYWSEGGFELSLHVGCARGYRG